MGKSDCIFEIWSAVWTMLIILYAVINIFGDVNSTSYFIQYWIVKTAKYVLSNRGGEKRRVFTVKEDEVSGV